MIKKTLKYHLISPLTFAWFIPIATCVFLLLFSSCQQKSVKTPDPDKGITRDVLPAHIQWFYKMANYEDSTYKDKFYQQYNSYWEQKQYDSALFVLIACNEVLDQNYIYDSTLLALTQKHLAERYNTTDNQSELAKLYYYIGSQHFSNNEQDSAMNWFRKGLANKHTLPRTKVVLRSMMSSSYSVSNQIDSAIAMRMLNLEYYLSRNDTTNIAINYINLSSAFDEVFARKLAIEFLDTGLHFAQLKKDTFTQLRGLEKLSGTCLNYDIDTPYFLAIAPRFNALYLPYSNKTINLKHIWALVNIQHYGVRKLYDSMPQFLDVMREISKTNMDQVEDDLRYFSGYYHYFTQHRIMDLDVLKAAAHQQFESKNYNEAIDNYYLLRKQARLHSDCASTLAYSDTITLLEEMCLKQNNQGELFEMEFRFQTKLKDKEIQLQKDTIEAKQRNIMLLLAAVIILALALSLTLLLQKQKALKLKRAQEETYMQQLMENTEDERRRIAKDLHDSIGHELLAVKNAISNKMQFTEDKIDYILSEVREISRNLFPAMFEEVGLTLSLQQLVDNTHESNGIYIICDVNYKDHTLTVKDELNIYRIVQEALSNTIKYADAKSVKIGIQHNGNEILFEYRDNGKGFDVMETLRSNRAFGLISIEQRCKAMGAKAHIESGTSGTHIYFNIPLKHV